MIYVQSKRRKIDNVRKEFPEVEIVDVTSKAEYPMVRFSPFYPLGDIPVPFTECTFSKSVEGIWQGLKVFENDDIDTTKFQITQMKGLKRTVRKFGTLRGHRRGVQGAELLDYITARKLIYLPSYQWALDHKLNEEIEILKEKSQKKPLVLLDYETNGDIDNPLRPLSHAHLIKMRLEGNF